MLSIRMNKAVVVNKGRIKNLQVIQRQYNFLSKRTIVVVLLCGVRVPIVLVVAYYGYRGITPPEEVPPTKVIIKITDDILRFAWSRTPSLIKTTLNDITSRFKGK